MAPSQKRSSYPAEASFAELRRCLVNLPTPLVNVLIDAKILIQNVVIEISWRVTDKKDGKQTTRSIYVGWSGQSSKARSDAVITQNGRQVRQPELLEIDAAFAKLIDLQEGTRVGLLLHSEVPQAHTVSIDPLTPADWEIIEMHSNFLETNFLAQVRALPNPSFKTSSGASNAHPLTLHLSATSTANVLVTSLSPPPPHSAPFAKISGDGAEVIVAPKSRTKQSTTDDDSKVLSPMGDKIGTTGPRNRKTESTTKPGLFLRGVNRPIAQEWFDDELDGERNEGLRIWADWSVTTSRELRGFNHVWVSVVRPSGLQASLDEDAEAARPATRVVATIAPWEEAPDAQHVALSSSLCALLDCPEMTGEMIRLEPAPPQASKTAVRSLRIFPFAATGDKPRDGFRFGGKSKAESAEAAQRLLRLYSNNEKGAGLLEGPITDGMILPPELTQVEEPAWPGGIVRLHPPPGPFLDAGKSTRGWLLGSDRKLVAASAGESSKASGNDRRLALEVMGESINILPASARWSVGEAIPAGAPELVGIENLTDQLTRNLRQSSSVLLTGVHGAGKTALSFLLAHTLRQQYLCHVTYFPCQSLVNDETRVSHVKDTFERVFGLAAWGARFGGRALVVLDDLDLLCPTETELEVGNDNGRARHISEVITAVARRHCSPASRVVLLATAQHKESIHNNIIAGHVVQEIVHLSAPDKELRYKVIEAIATRNSPSSRSAKDGTGSIDFLDIAGRTDGFMPGDLILLESRARSESVIRALSSDFPPSEIDLEQQDFDAALKGFTPTSLRNVTLQHSAITFASIGGLKATRQTLMETLQYPTLYGPIFAKCPLRLRSGLLLYGFPGCGKTLLASAVAGECGLNFISVKGPEILNKYIGASEKSVRDLFERAQAARPCVLFFDEFDSVAPKRGHDSTGVTDRVVNQLLTQMDGAEGLSGVYVLAATSRPDLIDPALLRPGRLDKSLVCNMPDEADRADILNALSSNLKVSDSARPRMRDVAVRTAGFTGADLQAVVYNAHLEAIHDLLGERDTGSYARHGSRDGSLGRNTAAIDFSHFRIGDGVHESKSATAQAQRASERAQIMQELLAHRATQQRARRMRRESVAGGRGHESQEEERADTEEPVIEWKHIERALQQTRQSISAEEVKRLGVIYQEFVASRNGEMPSGQGGNEIGGRTSLM